jgi:folate-dependent phosphoribosylglycinamide formyltransferase PurN
VKIVVVYSPDPNYMSPFILKILQRYGSSIIAVVQTRGSIIRRKTRLKQMEYLLGLLFILGVRAYLRVILKTLCFRLRRRDVVQAYCETVGIPFRVGTSINSEEVIAYLRSLGCDLIFNQSHHIVTRQALQVARVGILNRHGAMLPSYKGRLSPFWQILNGDAEGGLTYHLLDEGIDTGPIVYQESIPITAQDDVNSMIAKMFALAVERFGLVLEILSRPYGAENLVRHPSSSGSYYSSPRLKDALTYRFRRWRHVG